MLNFGNDIEARERFFKASEQPRRSRFRRHHTASIALIAWREHDERCASCRVAKAVSFAACRQRVVAIATHETRSTKRVIASTLSCIALHARRVSHASARAAREELKASAAKPYATRRSEHRCKTFEAPFEAHRARIEYTR
jgi:hypothetical protein